MSKWKKWEIWEWYWSASNKSYYSAIQKTVRSWRKTHQVQFSARAQTSLICGRIIPVGGTWRIEPNLARTFTQCLKPVSTVVRSGSNVQTIGVGTRSVWIALIRYVPSKLLRCPFTKGTDCQSKQICVAGTRRGKTCVRRESRLILVLLLIGWEGDARFFKGQMNQNFEFSFF